MNDDEKSVAAWYLVLQQAPPRSSTLISDHFESPKLRAWWANALTAADGKWMPSDVGIGLDEMLDLQDRFVLEHQIPRIERRIIERWCLRRTQAACAAFLDAKAPVVEYEKNASALLVGLTEAMAGRPVSSMSHAKATHDLTRRWVEEIRAPHPTINVPWKTLETKIRGIPRGRLVFVGGRSSEHKTTFVRALAEHAARKGSRVLFWTLEDSTDDIANRTIAASYPDVKVASGDLANGLVPAGYSKTEIGLQRMFGDLRPHMTEDWTKRLCYHDEGNPTLQRVLSVIRAETARGMDMFVGDFIQLISTENTRDPVGWWRQCCASLSALAKELGIAMVWTSQIEKTGTKDSEGRIPRGIEMPFGAQLRQGAYGVIMVGTLPNIHGKLLCVIDKWKSSERETRFALKLDAAHDKLEE